MLENVVVCFVVMWGIASIAMSCFAMHKENAWESQIPDSWKSPFVEKLLYSIKTGIMFGFIIAIPCTILCWITYILIL